MRATGMHWDPVEWEQEHVDHLTKKKVANAMWVKILYKIVYLIKVGYMKISLNLRYFSRVFLYSFSWNKDFLIKALIHAYLNKDQLDFW